MKYNRYGPFSSVMRPLNASFLDSLEDFLTFLDAGYQRKGPFINDVTRLDASLINHIENALVAQDRGYHRLGPFANNGFGPSLFDIFTHIEEYLVSLGDVPSSDPNYINFPGRQEPPQYEHPLIDYPELKEGE